MEEVGLGDPPAAYGRHFTQWGLCYGSALEGGQAVVSCGNHRCEAWARSCHSPFALDKVQEILYGLVRRGLTDSSFVLFL